MRSRFAGALLRGGKNLCALGAADLVALVDEPELPHVRLVGKKVNEPFIGRHKGAAGIHDDHHTHQTRAFGNVAANERRPACPHLGARLGVTVTGQVPVMTKFASGKIYCSN